MWAWAQWGREEDGRRLTQRESLLSYKWSLVSLFDSQRSQANWAGALRYGVPSSGTFSTPRSSSFHLLPPSSSSPHPLHPFCPCHNFIPLHVISKLAPNEFLISLNSVAVVITFIVFGFAIPHAGSAAVYANERVRGKETGRETDVQTWRQRQKRGEHSQVAAFYNPIWKFKMCEEMKAPAVCAWERQEWMAVAYKGTTQQEQVVRVTEWGEQEM